MQHDVGSYAKRRGHRTISGTFSVIFRRGLTEATRMQAKFGLHQVSPESSAIDSYTLSTCSLWCFYHCDIHRNLCQRSEETIKSCLFAPNPTTCFKKMPCVVHILCKLHSFVHTYYGIGMLMYLDHSRRMMYIFYVIYVCIYTVYIYICVCSIISLHMSYLYYDGSMTILAIT